MVAELVTIAVAVAVGSALLTARVRRLALAHGVLDVPNLRSSHRIPTPRGGGAAIVVTATAAFCVLAALGVLDTHFLAALLGGLAVAVVGFLDDRRPVRARVRLAVHFGAAAWALWCLGGLPPLRVGGQLVALGGLGNVLGVFLIVWTLNLFNFMDGIDGLATSEAIFVAWCGALLEPGAAVPAAGIVLGAACCGFLFWNRPPARIFMGDVGSGFLGYVLGVLIIAATRTDSTAPWNWLILGGVFFVDATVTLVRRAARGDRVFEAHRSHAYQWLARRWGSHGRVTVAVTVLNCLWLLPLAYWSSASPGQAVWMTLVALALLLMLAIAAGAGRAEAA